jgi:hypothetical protein
VKRESVTNVSRMTFSSARFDEKGLETNAAIAVRPWSLCLWRRLQTSSNRPSKPKEPTLKQIMVEMNTVVDDREPALQLSEINVWVHRIKKVAITSEDYTVNRTSWDKKAFREFEKNQTANPIMPLFPADPIEI